MRRIAAHVEALAAIPFILLVGLVGGAVQSIPRFLLGGTGATSPHFVQFLVVGIGDGLSWTAALLLWWIAVRRQQWSLWTTAAHLTLGIALADVLTSALGMVVASIDTNGMFAEAIASKPLEVALSNLVLPLIRSPLWFLGSAMAIALGRHLIAGPRTVAPSQSMEMLSDPVT